MSREIKLLKNKFEMLEKCRQFRSLLQKSNVLASDRAGPSSLGDELAIDLNDLTSNAGSRRNSLTNGVTNLASGPSAGPLGSYEGRQSKLKSILYWPFKNVFHKVGNAFRSCSCQRPRFNSLAQSLRRRTSKIHSLTTTAKMEDGNIESLILD